MVVSPFLQNAVQPIDYPESDGLPMSDNTIQFRWIVTLYGNLAAWFQSREDVFVSGNQNWYPVEGEPSICAAPDVYVVFGRPKGDRRSWKQWEEDDVPMTVVFEVLSPKNTPLEMADKLDFYDRHGVEEYYVYDPEANKLHVYHRGQATLRRVHPVEGIVSPRLGIRFVMTQPQMTVFLPDGRPFASFEEYVARSQQAEQARDQMEARFRRLAELSRKVRQGSATPDEVRELDRLEAEA